jgi:diguanylate cyclase (GGDEF)-like protein
MKQKPEFPANFIPDGAANATACIFFRCHKPLLCFADRRILTYRGWLTRLAGVPAFLHDSGHVDKVNRSGDPSRVTAGSACLVLRGAACGLLGRKSGRASWNQGDWVSTTDEHRRHQPANIQQDKLATDIRGWQPDAVFAIAILVAAVAALLYSRPEAGPLAGGYDWRTAVFFLMFGLFTITMGYARPGFGHVSFDRVAQVSSILVLGPFDAAWINGLASLVYPWHRIWTGVPLRTVLTASMHNAGMMVIVILTCGSLYAYLGGPIPLVGLDLKIGGLLLLLMLSMQILNDSIMAGMMYFRKVDPSSILNYFSMSIELASVPLAILIAIVYVRMDLAIFALLLFCLGLGMAVFRQFAEIRNRLEALVEERTRELRQKSLELERQATHDKLTGIFNRRYADEYLQREIDSSRRYDRKFTIAFADIDHFKQINDLYSHAIGDAVLCRVANILVDRCRKTDVVARYGGEEFLLCFPDTNSEFAEQICGQIRIAVENADWSSLASRVGGDLRITISFGVAELGGDAGRTTILSDADSRLYQAKNRGRNRVVA